MQNATTSTSINTSVYAYRAGKGSIALMTLTTAPPFRASITPRARTRVQTRSHVRAHTGGKAACALSQSMCAKDFKMTVTAARRATTLGLECIHALARTCSRELEFEVLVVAVIWTSVRLTLAKMERRARIRAISESRQGCPSLHWVNICANVLVGGMVLIAIQISMSVKVTLVNAQEYVGSLPLMQQCLLRTSIFADARWLVMTVITVMMT